MMLLRRAQLERLLRDKGAESLRPTRREVDGFIARGNVEAIRAGWFVEAEQWRRLYAEDRHRLRVLAAAEAARSAQGPVFSHYSAAVLHGLPLYRLRSTRVHTVSPVPVGRSNRVTVRTVAALDPGEIRQLDGIRFTDLTRTVLDVARIASPELAVACADAAVRRVAEEGGDWKEWVRDAKQRLEARSPSPGIVAARRVLDFADPRAESPIESVSRLYLWMLGYDVETQVPVRSPAGLEFFVDFRLVGLGILGEADGKSKYTEERIRGSRTADEVVYAEKRREDWIRGVTKERMIRWGAGELSTLDVFADYLRSLDVPLPIRRRRRF